jgi:23S rRNA maturation mini-RNase III
MKPIQLATSDEIDAAYEQGKVAVKALFRQQAVLIRALEARIRAAEDQIVKNSRNSGKPPCI